MNMCVCSGSKSPQVPKGSSNSDLTTAAGGGGGTIDNYKVVCALLCHARNFLAYTQKHTVLNDVNQHISVI